MEDPVAEIAGVVKSLCTTSPSTQHAALAKYFTKNASFVHPICRVDSFANSRWYIGEIYLWYKILSPKVDITSYSIGYDKENQVLYVASQQYWKLWFFPAITPRLLTVLSLTTEVDDDFNAVAESAPKQNANSTGSKKYYIKKQQDMYQPNELIRYFNLFTPGIAAGIITLIQIWATMFCVIATTIFFPVVSLEESESKSYSRNKASY